MIPGKAIIQIISARKSAGKTAVGTKIVKELKTRGFKVAVVKHVFHRIDVQGKDSDRYRRAGAENIVLVSERELGFLSYGDWGQKLENIVQKLPISENIVLVEGFKKIRDLPKIIVLKEPSEFEELRKYVGNCLAIVCKEPSKLPEETKCKKFSFNEVGKVVDIIVDYSIRKITGDLPGIDCGFCGYSTCKDFAYAILRGVKSIEDCPIKSEVELKVNNRKIHLSPYPRQVLIGILKGYLESLKGVPEEIKEISIYIKFDKK